MHFKKQKLKYTYYFTTKQSCIDDNKLSTNNLSNTDNTDVDTDADTDKKGTWFWNKSANESKSNLECSGNSEEEGNLAPITSRIE